MERAPRQLTAHQVAVRKVRIEDLRRCEAGFGYVAIDDLRGFDIACLDITIDHFRFRDGAC